MATFSTAYNTYVKPVEGGYANVANDKGGETYAGISRKFHPSWSGWSVIDNYKLKAGAMPARNKKFPELDTAVYQFYQTLWTNNNFGLITNQDVANILYDWFVNSGSNVAYTKGAETYGVDEILNRDFGFKLPMDSKVDTATVNAINSVNSSKLHSIVKAERKRFYEQLIKADPTQQVFANGWFARISKFPDLYAAGIGGIGILLLALGIAFMLTMQDKPNRRNEQTVSTT